MILHLSHIFLTEGRTFISQFLSVMRSLLYTNVQPQTLLPRFGEENPRFPLLEAVRDAPAIQVVDGQLYRDLIAREDLDVVHTHLPRNVGQDLVAVLELDLEHRVRQRFKDRALKLDDILFRQLCSPLNVDLRQQHEMISNI
jgi:hypothetical protein